MSGLDDQTAIAYAQNILSIFHYKQANPTFYIFGFACLLNIYIFFIIRMGIDNNSKRIKYLYHDYIQFFLQQNVKLHFLLQSELFRCNDIIGILYSCHNCVLHFSSIGYFILVFFYLIQNVLFFSN